MKQETISIAGVELEVDETVHGIRTFAREVYPRLKATYPNTGISGFHETGKANVS